MADSKDDEMADYFAGIGNRSKKKLADAADLIARFTVFAASKGVSLSADSFEYIQTTGIVAKAPGIARALLGPLSVQRDGLLSFTEISSRFPNSSEGCFWGPNFILMAHPCYRRGMHWLNNWAPRFIDIFCELDGPGIDKYLALDDQRVRIDLDGGVYFEADTWYAAPFDKDVRNIKSAIGKLRPPLDLEPSHVSFFFSDVYCLDIKWSESDGIKTFQALEVKTEKVRIEAGGQHYFPARYLHAEFDLAANCFRHFDGAIQLFTEEEYFQRRDADFHMTMKNSAHIKARSHKAFKINGPLQTKNWVELCCHFFVGNPLTFEYFNGGYPQHIIEKLARIKERASQLPDVS
jgi:hypothetical protein